jgi:hypothetical protein
VFGLDLKTEREALGALNKEIKRAQEEISRIHTSELKDPMHRLKFVDLAKENIKGENLVKNGQAFEKLLNVLIGIKGIETRELSGLYHGCEAGAQRISGDGAGRGRREGARGANGTDALATEESGKAQALADGPELCKEVSKLA